jgi:hypothetical protein
MPKIFAYFLALVVMCGAVAACSRKVEEAKPVATPSVTLSRTDAAVGSPVDITYKFTVAADAPAFAEDYIVFVHFIDADGEQMWTDDHEPPTPTRQWKPGQTIEYQRTIFIPKFPYVGATDVALGLYSRTSGERLPLGGQDRGMRAYNVAKFNMTLQSESTFVIFKDGWHETEVAQDGSLEWQWSKREGTIAFRNPKRDSVLLLQVDQAANALPQPQQVDVRLGSTVVDSFALPVGTRELRRIQLPATLLGAAETIELTVAVDKTFVPAEVPSLRSSDSRELGIRVFRAYVEPK